MRHAFLGILIAMVAMVVIGCECTTCDQAHMTGEPCPPKTTSKCKPGEMMDVQAQFPQCGDCKVATIHKSAPGQVIQGQEFSYTLTVRSTAEMPLENVRVMEELPSNFKLARTEPSSKQDGQMLTWKLGTLRPKEQKTLKIYGQSTAPGELMSCTDLKYNEPAVCMTIQSVNPRLQITKHGPSKSILCDPITYTIVAKNVGTGTACDIELRETLPKGLKTLDGRQEKIVRIDELEPGESREITIQAKADQTGQYESQLLAFMNGSQVGSETLRTEVGSPSLVITKELPQKRYIGRPIQYSITVRNNGDMAAKNTRLKEQLNRNVKFQSATHNGQASGQDVMWDLGTIEAGQEKTVTLTVLAQEKGELAATSRARAYCGAGKARDTMEIEGIPAILLEAIDKHDPIEVGAQTTYLVRVTNQGSAVGTNISIKVMLPKEQQFMGAEGPTKGQVSGNTIDFLPLSRLEPGQQATWTIEAKGTDTGDVRFRVELNSDQMTSSAMEEESTHIYK
jgi:uncharacterized repeat protein (TIGR01451 family)